MTYITTSNVYWDRFELKDLKTIPFMDSELDKCTVSKGDLLICEGGDVGRSAIWDLDYNIRIQNHIHRLRPIGEVNVRFYFYVLMYNKQAGLIGGKGIGLMGLSSGELDKMVVPLPPINEQRRIADEIGRLFSSISILEQGVCDLKNAVQKAKSRILDLALSGRLTSHTSHYQQLPEGWELKALGDIGRWQSGGTPTRSNKAFYNGNIPWLKIADLNDGYIEQTSEHISEDGLKNSSAKLNPANSVCVGMYGSIGKAGILSFPATTNQAICVCSNLRGITSEFLFYYIVSQRKHLISKAGGGVQANISKEIIIKYQIPLPPMEEQLRIIKEIHQYSSIIDRINSLL